MVCNDIFPLPELRCHIASCGTRCAYSEQGSARSQKPSTRILLFAGIIVASCAAYSGSIWVVPKITTDFEAFPPKRVFKNLIFSLLLAVSTNAFGEIHSNLPGLWIFWSHESISSVLNQRSCNAWMTRMAFFCWWLPGRLVRFFEKCLVITTREALFFLQNVSILLFFICV